MGNPGSTSPLLPRPFRGRTLPVFAWWAFLFMAVQFLAASFVLAERTVYTWDCACFWTTAVKLARTAGASLASAWEEILHSIRFDDYNLLHSVPQALLVHLFGTSRLVYVLGVIDLYALPGVFILFLICRRFASRLTPGMPRLPHLVVPAVILLFPFFWSPALKGYPGVGGVIPIFLIFHLYFDRPLPGLSWKRAAAIGLALAWLQLFRRFYSFWIISFALLVLLDGTAAYLQAREDKGRVLLRVILLPALTGAVATAVVLPLAWDFILRVAATRYGDIYSAYRKTVGIAAFRELVEHWFGYLGLLVFLVSLTFLTLDRKTRRIALFLGPTPS